MSTQKEWVGCQFCDSPGGDKTCEYQVRMPLSGRVQGIDYCLHRIVAALNAGGVLTEASCCGHRTIPGNIILADERVLAIFDSMKEAEGFGVWSGSPALHPDY